MTDRLYDLLPAVYRRRDAETGGALRRFLQVFEEELERHEGDAWRAYDNWFIETCEEAVVPLIGELVGVHLPHPVTDVTRSQRQWVANAIARRRRKGTASSLADLARDVTGHDAMLVESFRRLAVAWRTVPSSRRPVAFCALRDPLPLEAVGRAGDPTARVVDLRSVSRARAARHHPAHAGVHLWRLRALPPLQAKARAATTPPDGRYFAHPSGLDAPLWHAEGEATETPAGGPLSRLALQQELEARRQAIVDGEAPSARWFVTERPVFEVRVDGVPVPPEEVVIADLSRELAAAPWWPRPPLSAPYLPASGGALVDRPIRVLVDPTNGRLSFRATGDGSVPEGAAVEVTARRGTLDVLGASTAPRPDLHGGFFARPAASAAWFERSVATPEALRTAVGEWNAASAAAAGLFVGRIELTASLVLEGGALEVSIPRLARLLLCARDGVLPTLRAPLRATGTALASDTDPGALSLDGLSLDGGVDVLAGSLGGITLAHCSALPAGVAAWSVLCEGGNERLRLRLLRSVIHNVRVTPSLAGISVEDSAVGRGSGDAVKALNTPLTVLRSTIFGDCAARRLDASDSIFTASLGVTEATEGCVRYCYLASPGALRRYACVTGRPGPSFTRADPASPAFAQLADGTPRAISEGASDGAEMGVFNRLQQPQRDANLRQCLDEHLPAGLDVGVFYES